MARLMVEGWKEIAAVLERQLGVSVSWKTARAWAKRHEDPIHVEIIRLDGASKWRVRARVELLERWAERRVHAFHRASKGTNGY